MFKLKSFINNTYISFFCSQLIIISFLLIFYLDNLDEISVNELARSILELIILTFFLYLIIGIAKEKITLFIPFGVVLILQYWNIYELFPRSFSTELLLAVVFIIWLLIISALWQKDIDELKNINMVFAFVIILGNTYDISSKFKNFYNLNKINPTFIEKSYEVIEVDIKHKNELPNIIYIVPDRYLGLNQLRDYYNFDNTSFYDELRKRNFIAPSKSRSNYPFTYASLLSTLNNSYLINNYDNLPQGASYFQIKESHAFKKIKSMGYKFVNFDNWWKGTQNITIADFNYYRNSAYLSSTTYDFIYFRTPIFAISDRIFPSRSKRFSCSEVKNKFNDLTSIASSKDSGLFIFAHFLVPHEPYLINADGGCNSRSFGGVPENTKQNYIGYLEYTNNKLLQIFDEISLNNDNFIFVIQSDEGQYPECFEEFNSCNLNDWDLKTGIINAFFYSKNHSLNEENFATPINNFSNIFDLIEDGSSEKEEHKIFIPTNKFNNFDFKEIVEIK